MRLLIATLLVCLLFGQAHGQETWSSPTTFTHAEVEVHILNYELTRDRKYLLVHAKLRSLAKDPLYFDWRSLILLQCRDGENLRPNFDALVDRNGAGLTRTVGEFELRPREKARITIPFLLGEDELPGKLLLPDGRVSREIR